MIKDMEDVCLFTKSDVANLPVGLSGKYVYPRDNSRVFKSDVVIRYSLPDNYVELARKYNIANVDIGYFSLHPGSGAVDDLESALLTYNGDGSPFLSLFRQNKFVQVAREESNPICIRNSNSQGAGNVYHIEVMAASTPRISGIAPDFATYIVMAANLQDVSARFDENPVAAQAEMAKCCAEANLNAEQTGFWVQRSIFNTDV
jgi:hypothetical protein